MDKQNSSIYILLSVSSEDVIFIASGTYNKVSEMQSNFSDISNNYKMVKIKLKEEDNPVELRESCEKVVARFGYLTDKVGSLLEEYDEETGQSISSKSEEDLEEDLLG